MQVDLSTVLTIVSTILTIAVGAWVAVARYALANRDQEINRRIDSTGSDLKEIDRRLHTEEKATIRQDGEINRVKDTHENLANDLAEIKRSMATKVEINGLERAIERLHTDLSRAQPSAYGRHPTPGAYRGPTLPTDSPPPPRPERK